jgi:methionine aminotransferase
LKFSLNTSAKLPQNTESIFSVMSGLANRYSAVNLSQGFPDFAVNQHLINLVNEGMNLGHNQYAPMAGLMSLREGIAEKTENLYGLKASPEKEITIVPGATFGIYAAITATVKDGDEVIIFEPAYDCYEPAVILNGGKVKRVELKYPNYSINWQEVSKLINFRTKMIILNSPHNPTGSILQPSDFEQLNKIVQGSDIIILSDEVYEHIIFDNHIHESIAKYPKLAERSFIISSFGKTYHATGWKMGYVIAPEELSRHLRSVYQYMVFSASTPMQYGYAQILKFPELYQELSAFYQEKRNIFRSLVQSSRFNVLPCSGSYFQLLDYSKITDANDEAYAKELAIDRKIASIPISVFYGKKIDNKVLRFCFAKKDETLKRAAEILCKI